MIEGIRAGTGLKFNSAKILLLCLAMDLLIIEGIFGVIAKNQINGAGLAIQGILQREYLLSNPYLLSQALLDLDRLGVMSCIQLRPVDQPDGGYFPDTRGSKKCSGIRMMLYPEIAHRIIPAGNGALWSAEYRTSFGAAFFIGLWVTRALTVSLILLLWTWFKSTERHRRQIVALQKGHEEKMRGAFHDIRNEIASLGNKIKLVPLKQEVKDDLTFNLSNMTAIALTNVNATTKPKAGPTSSQLGLQPAASIGGTVAVLEEDLDHVTRDSGVFVDLVIPKWAYRAFVPIRALDLHRVLSNLCGNAMHSAQQGEPRISVSIQRNDGRIHIGVRDFGFGFTEEARRAFERNEIYSSKADGNGRGLRSTRALLGEAQGTLELVSSDQTGAYLVVDLPICEPPVWFFDVHATELDEILLLDDSPEVNQRLRAALPNTQVTYFTDEASFLLAAHAQQGTLLFVDYSYGGHRNGLDLISAEKLSDRAVLFTGRAHFDSHLQEAAVKAGVKIVPKECLISKSSSAMGKNPKGSFSFEGEATPFESEAP